MKRSLLFAFALAVSVSAMAQKSPSKIKGGIPAVSKAQRDYNDTDFTKTTSNIDVIAPQGRGTSDITVVNLGTAANAYGLYNGGRTALWADPNLNAITFVHRMTASPGSGFIAYDLSTDGGNTWTVNNQVFNPNAGGTAPARYPQGLINNPQGNTSIDNAFFTAFFPTLDGSNTEPGSWGGYGTATVRLNGQGLNQAGWPSDPPIRQNVPDAMTVNPVTNDVFIVEPALLEGLGTGYTDTLVITRGILNASTGTYEWEQEPFYAPMVHGTNVAGIADLRIAFAPDGLIGYISMLADNEGDPMATGLAYYPILYKTTDGGITWGEDPIVVPLGGPDGLGAIVEGLLTDDQIAEIFAEPIPSRDEIVYTTAFTHDLAVDFNGNPVISVVIGVAGSNPYSIADATRLYASYNIFSRAQGTEWYAQKLGDNLITFRGEWITDFSEDNRSQITTTYDGTKMFFSWLDTDFEGVETNTQPDIYLAAWDVVNNMYTEVINVTYLSDAWLQAFMGTASYYALIPEAGTYIIPLMYQEMTPTDPAQPVQYKYIKDFTITDAMFTITDTRDIQSEAVVSQNFPNPFTGKTEVTINLLKQANVSLEVFNMVGQKVYEIPVAQMMQGIHKLSIELKNLKAGIYTYTVKINNERITRKMIAE